MERLYCTINEEQARIAHDMMSMSDYKVGSKTEEYRGYVDKAYDLAEKVAEARPRETDRVEALAKRYSKRMAEYMNRESNIGCRCPSVMISGAGNFPVKKKEKQVQAWEKNHQFYTETQKILDKIKGILRGKDIIKSSDEDAIERLEEKLDALKENQERMRAVNKAIRLKNTKKGDEELKTLGYSDEQIQELRTPDFMGRVGFPAYALQNNNANIHRVEERLKSLKAVKEKGTKETEFELFKVVENAEAMRLQIIFDEKPEADVRAVLKKNGFKWAPSQGGMAENVESGRQIRIEPSERRTGGCIMPELLTAEIANEYRILAENLPENGRQDTGERRELRQELQGRCGLSELQAINILNGFHVKDYIAIKEREYAENERRKAERDQDT